MTLSKALKPLFFITAIYSFVALPVFAETAGPCNAAVLVMGIGFFLLLCTVLTCVAVFMVTRSSPGATIRTAAKVLSGISLLIWGFWSVGASIDEPVAGIAYFLPFLITVIITCKLAYA